MNFSMRASRPGGACFMAGSPAAGRNHASRTGRRSSECAAASAREHFGGSAAGLARGLGLHTHPPHAGPAKPCAAAVQLGGPSFIDVALAGTSCSRGGLAELVVVNVGGKSATFGAPRGRGHQLRVVVVLRTGALQVVAEGRGASPLRRRKATKKIPRRGGA
jgi:hypothetical protein